MNIKDFLKILDSAKRWDHNINYQENPMLYLYTECCGGMYTCKPYSKELLGMYKFLGRGASEKTANNLYSYFLKKVKDSDFVGADLSRKYIQSAMNKRTISSASRAVFANFYSMVEKNEGYIFLKKDFLDRKQELKATKKK